MANKKNTRITTADIAKENNNGGSTFSKKPSRLGFFVLLSAYYKKYLFRWIGLIIFTIITAGITIALPKLTNIIMSNLSQGIIDGKHPPMADIIVIYWAIGFGVSFIIQGLFMYLQSLIGGSIARKIEIDIRIKVLNKLVDLDMNYYHDKKMGDILTKLISDTQILGDQSYQVPQNFLNAFFVFLGSIIVMFTLDNPSSYAGVASDGRAAVVELSGIILGVSFAILLLTSFGFTFIRKLTLKQRRVVSAINGDVNDRINAIRLIKSSGTAQYEKKRFEKIHKDYYIVSMQTIRAQSLVIAFVVTTLFSMNTIALIVGIIFINQGKLNPTVLLSVSMSINSLIMPIIQVVRLLSNLATASASSTRVMEIFDAKAKVNENLNGPKLPEIKGNIIFENVSFKYDVDDKKEPLILKNFNFTFEQGKSYAIVGETGVGKSTIAKLLLRYYDPTQGTIYVNNNKDLSKINLASYLTHLGYVEQEPQVLYGTFYDNIRYASFDATNEEIEAAAKKAELYDFVQQLPNKFDTILGERGFILSGGQKQRLVIARMFLRNPDILILDEATSSLDNIVEKEIQTELDLLMQNRTSIVIAHRLSTIKNVDQILVLEKDKGVVETGTFNDLKKQEGRFKKLYEAGLMD